MAKPKGKSKKQAPSKTKKSLAKPVASRKRAAGGEVSPAAIEFARSVWPGIKKSTQFIKVPQFHTAVTYDLPSGASYTATLKWFSVSHGSKILGHYDEATDVCYIGEFIQG